MSLVAGSGDAGVWMDETAFGFVEPCVRRAWPAYSGYAHWGRTRIPITAWHDVVAQMLALRTSLLAAGGADDVVGIGFLFKHLRPEFARRFDEIRPGIVAMIDAIVAWSARDCAHAECVTILGV